MVFVKCAAGRDFFQLWQTIIARRNALAIQNTRPGNPILRRIVHYARDQVPLCSCLQIPTGIARFLGAYYWKLQFSGGTHGILRYDYHRTAALG